MSGSLPQPGFRARGGLTLVLMMLTAALCILGALPVSGQWPNVFVVFGLIVSPVAIWSLGNRVGEIKTQSTPGSRLILVMSIGLAIGWAFATGVVLLTLAYLGTTADSSGTMSGLSWAIPGLIYALYTIFFGLSTLVAIPALFHVRSAAASPQTSDTNV